MKKSLMTCAVLAGLLALGGCETLPAQADGAAPTPQSARQASSTLSFVDFGGFDRDMHSALQLQAPVVTVLMYDKVSPNNTPDRLQKWLNAVEKNGGKVEVEPPPNELTPKNPLALISLIGGLWNVIKASADLRDQQLTRAVKGHDAVISLERNDAGQVVVSKILFRKASGS
jgi:hypothetical protein